MLSVNRPTTVGNDVVGVLLGHAVMGEQGLQEGTEHAPWPRVEYQRGRCVVTYPYHLRVARQEVQDPLQREVISPRVLSLLMSFEGILLLNAEL